MLFTLKCYLLYKDKMFSFTSFMNFVSINSVITAFSVVKCTLCDIWNSSFVDSSTLNAVTTNTPFIDSTTFIGTTILIALVPFIISEMVTNVFLIRYTNAPNKKYIETNSSTERTHEPVEEYKGEFILNMLHSSLIKGVVHYYIFNSLIECPSISGECQNFLFDIGTFIMKSFVLEIIFDGCHYIIHRTAHSNALLYKYVHKKHHKHKHPSVWTTFYMHPVDILLSYGVPLYISLRVVNSLVDISKIQFYMYITYLSLQEIAGHSGKAMYPSSGFAQCVWLPKLFHFELYTDDHDLHHTKFTCNYSKRFVLWDKLFGTYVRPPTIPTFKKNKSVFDKLHKSSRFSEKDK